MKLDIHVKRVYEDPSDEDGTRVLVDRLWPRGIKKERLAAQWLKDIAPSTELRKWFQHEQPKWDEFKARYLSELDNNPEPVEELLAIAEKGRVTLLYSTKDSELNHASVLREYLLAHARPS
jgi:uncharacterized protein YeaO (DUF488 family)